MSKYLLSLSLALCLADSPLPIAAQNLDQNPERNLEQGGQERQESNEATAQCITLAQKMYPDDSIASQANRAVAYKECMNAAGLHR